MKIELTGILALAYNNSHDGARAFPQATIDKYSKDFARAKLEVIPLESISGKVLSAAMDSFAGRTDWSSVTRDDFNAARELLKSWA